MCSEYKSYPHTLDLPKAYTRILRIFRTGQLIIYVLNTDKHQRYALFATFMIRKCSLKSLFDLKFVYIIKCELVGESTTPTLRINEAGIP